MKWNIGERVRVQKRQWSIARSKHDLTGEVMADYGPAVGVVLKTSSNSSSVAYLLLFESGDEAWFGDSQIEPYTVLDELSDVK